MRKFGQGVRKSFKDRHSEIDNPFGYQVYTDRTAAKLTTQELAEKAKVSRQSVEQTEWGDYVPLDEHVRQYATALGKDQNEYLMLAHKSRAIFAAKRKKHERRFARSN